MSEPLSDYEIEHLRRAYHPSSFGTGSLIHRALDEVAALRASEAQSERFGTDLIAKVNEYSGKLQAIHARVDTHDPTDWVADLLTILNGGVA